MMHVAEQKSSPERHVAAVEMRDAVGRHVYAYRHPLVASVLCALATSYMGYYFDRGWIPSDEGLLAHSAERFLTGELPHRDFHEAYTGGLTFVHGLAFQLFGLKLTSLRIVLAIFALGFVLAVYFIAARQGPWWVAAITTAGCFVWSVPNYFVGMPSWYILFLSTFGTLSLLRYLDTRRRRWLFVAGVCGGLALLVKIVALYFIAAALMLLMYREQVESGIRNNGDGHRRSPAFVAFTSFVCALLMLFVFALLHHDLGPMELANYIVPIGSLCGLLAWNEWNEGRGRFATRFTHLSGAVLCLLGGVLLPVICFLIPFALGNALGDLYQGVIVLPRRRLQFANLGFQPLNTMLPMLLPAMIVLAGCLRRSWPGRVGNLIISSGLVLVAVLLLFFLPNWYYWGVFALRGLLPAIVCAACILLLRKDSGTLPADRRQEMFLVAAVASMGSLIQYPFAALIYFCYCAPLVLLALHFVTTSRANRWPAANVGLLVFFLAFAFLRVNAGYLTDPRNSIWKNQHVLNLERGGLRIQEAEKQHYETIIKLVQSHSHPGSSIYAAPDCPEIYFLANRKNPTPTIYDFFDDPEDRTERILRRLDECDVQVVVVNLRPLFSSPVGSELAAGLRVRFPQRRRVGDFVVAVRGPATQSGRGAPAVGNLTLER